MYQDNATHIFIKEVCVDVHHVWIQSLENSNLLNLHSKVTKIGLRPPTTPWQTYISLRTNPHPEKFSGSANVHV